MLLELLAFLVCLVVGWFVQFRPRSRFNVRPPYILLRRAPDPQRHASFDYVVVGGGPGGLAAARALLEKTEKTGESILLVERGGESLPEAAWQAYGQSAFRDRLLSFAPDMVFLPANSGLLPGKLGPTLLGEPAEVGSVARRPFRVPCDDDVEADGGAAPPTSEAPSPSPPPKSVKARILETLFSYTAYPQGRGIGGTARLDWGVHLPHVLSHAAEHGNEGRGEGRRRRWWELPVSLTKVRNPLSWAFAEAAAAQIAKTRYMPTEDQPCKRHAVYPVFLRVDVDGRRLPVSSALLGDVPEPQLRRLSVLVNHTVVSLNPGDEGGRSPASRDTAKRVVESITSANMDRNGGALGAKHYCTISVRKGVVVSAGVAQTPRLLRALAPAPLRHARACRIRDVLALPMVFRAQPGISMDAKNTQDAKGTARWYLSQRGPYLQPMTDTVASVPVPELGPAAEMRLFFLPFGGRDPRRFYQLGWDRVLGSFDDAVTVLMVLTGADGLTHPLELDPEHSSGSAVGTRGLLRQRHLRPLAVVEDVVAVDGVRGEENAEGEVGGQQEAASVWEPQLQRNVIQAFVRAMRASRSVTSVTPLSHLVPPRGGRASGDAGEEAIDYGLLKEDPVRAVQLARLMHTRGAKRTSKMKRELARLLEWAYTCADSDGYMQRYVAQHAYWLGFGSGSSEPFLSKTDPFFVDGFANAVVGDNSVVTKAMWADAGRDSLAAGGVNNAVHVGMLAAEALVAEGSL